MYSQRRQKLPLPGILERILFILVAGHAQLPSTGEPAGMRCDSFSLAIDLLDIAGTAVRSGHGRILVPDPLQRRLTTGGGLAATIAAGPTSR